MTVTLCVHFSAFSLSPSTFLVFFLCILHCFFMSAGSILEWDATGVIFLFCNVVSVVKTVGGLCM